MIQVDLSNVWGKLTLPELLTMEKEVFSAHMTLSEGQGDGSHLLGWMTLPVQEPTPELLRIQDAARRAREVSEVCVVVGIGGSYLGARAAIELLQGPNRNVGRGRGDPQIYFAGNSLSTRHWNELTRILEGKDFSVLVISKSGTTTEPAIAFRSLKWMLERKYGTDGARKRIFAVTDPIHGALRQMSDEEGWESFAIPTDVGGRYSVLSPSGLLPMAVAGIDIMELLRGAYDARQDYDLRSFENPVWLYACARNALYRKSLSIELLASFEPGFQLMGQWWQKLFAESEGKKGRGLFPVTAQFTTDLHALGQMIQQGPHNLFETMLRFDPPQERVVIDEDAKNLDGLNYIAGKTLDYVDEHACLGAIAAHSDAGVPIISMDCGALEPRTVGELFYFFQLSCAISAYMLGVNPFTQPGAELYKANMFQFLGKPGYANQ